MAMRLPDGGLAEVVATWDAVAAQEDGSPEYEGRITSIVVRNTSSIYTVIGIFRRGNGVVEQNRELAPGGEFTYTGQGPIRNVEDIPNIGLTYRL